MRSFYIYKMALRNISRNRRRTVLSATAIGLAVMLVCFMNSYVTGLMNNVQENILAFESGHIKVINKEYVKEEKLMPLDLNIFGYEKDYTEVMDLIKKVNGVKYVLPRTKFGAILNIDGKMKNMIGWALDPELEAPVNPLTDKIIKGRMFRDFAPGQSEMVMGKALAAELKLDAGDRITLMTKTAEEGLGHMTFTITGIAAYNIGELDKMFFYIPLSAAAKFLKMEHEVMELAVYLDDYGKSIPVAREINKLLEGYEDNPYEAFAWEKQRDGQYYVMVGMSGKMYNIIYLIFLVLASLVVINTTMMVVFERMKEIGTIAALGMRGSAIVRLFFFEAVTISVIGSFAGTLLGGAASYVISKTGINLAKMTGGTMNLQFSEIMYPSFNPGLLIFSFVFGVFVASLCAYIPASRAARIEPVEALRRIF